MKVLTVHLLIPGDVSRADAIALKRVKRAFRYECLDVFTTDIDAGKPADARDALWTVYDRARIANAGNGNAKAAKGETHQ